jgi:4-hydroxythreonine-4-phosphate dehydrogenase
MKPSQLLVVTPGEPAGIGPECLLRAWQEQPGLELVAIADPDLLRRTDARLALDVPVVTWSPGQPLSATALACLPVTLDTPETAGRSDPRNAGYVLACLDRAVSLLRSDTAGAMVTGPVHKGVINDAGIPFTGHTEYLAALAGIDRVVMMLAAGRLRVTLVTTHLPLRAVPDAVTGAAVRETIRITDDALRSQFGIARPVLQVLGLNPHAGEGGHLGSEDDAVIAPAIAHCRAAGIDARGPVPADTAFTPGRLQDCDAVVAMYHDQGLPVLKHAGFGHAVNVTLGLPFIRTSVDHGTALDIAAQGGADPGSLLAALQLAQQLCRG